MSGGTGGGNNIPTSQGGGQNADPSRSVRFNDVVTEHSFNPQQGQMSDEQLAATLQRMELAGQGQGMPGGLSGIPGMGANGQSGMPGEQQDIASLLGGGRGQGMQNLSALGLDRRGLSSQGGGGLGGLMGQGGGMPGMMGQGGGGMPGMMGQGGGGMPGMMGQGGGGMPGMMGQGGGMQELLRQGGGGMPGMMGQGRGMQELLRQGGGGGMPGMMGQGGGMQELLRQGGGGMPGMMGQGRGMQELLRQGGGGMPGMMGQGGRMQELLRQGGGGGGTGSVQQGGDGFKGMTQQGNERLQELLSRQKAAGMTGSWGQGEGGGEGEGVPGGGVPGGGGNLEQLLEQGGPELRERVAKNQARLEELLERQRKAKASGRIGPNGIGSLREMQRFLQESEMEAQQEKLLQQQQGQGGQNDARMQELLAMQGRGMAGGGGFPGMAGGGGFPGMAGGGGFPGMAGGGGFPGMAGMGQGRGMGMHPMMMGRGRGMPMPGGGGRGGMGPGGRGAGGAEDFTQRIIQQEIEKAKTCTDSLSYSGMSTIIMLDTSASMQGEPLQDAVQAIERLLSGMESNAMDHGLEENVALITFGMESQTKVVQHITNDYTKIRTALGRLEAQGGTPLHMAMLYILGTMERATQAVIDGYIVHPRIIIVSDGNLTDSGNTHPDILTDQSQLLQVTNLSVEIAQQLAQQFAIKMFFIPVGSPNPVVPEMLSGVTGGSVVLAGDAKWLSRTYLHYVIVGRVAGQVKDLNIDRGTVEAVAKEKFPEMQPRDIDSIMELLKEVMSAAPPEAFSQGEVPVMPGQGQMGGPRAPGLGNMPRTPLVPGMSGGQQFPGQQMLRMSGGQQLHRLPSGQQLPGGQQLLGQPGSNIGGTAGIPGLRQTSGQQLPGQPGSNIGGTAGIPGLQQMSGQQLPGQPGSNFGGTAGIPGLPHTSGQQLPGQSGCNFGDTAGIPGLGQTSGGISIGGICTGGSPGVNIPGLDSRTQSSGTTAGNVPSVPKEAQSSGASNIQVQSAPEVKDKTKPTSSGTEINMSKLEQETRQNISTNQNVPSKRTEPEPSSSEQATSQSESETDDSRSKGARPKKSQMKWNKLENETKQMDTSSMGVAQSSKETNIPSGKPSSQSNSVPIQNIENTSSDDLSGKEKNDAGQSKGQGQKPKAKAGYKPKRPQWNYLGTPSDQEDEKSQSKKTNKTDDQHNGQSGGLGSAQNLPVGGQGSTGQQVKRMSGSSQSPKTSSSQGGPASGKQNVTPVGNLNDNVSGHPGGQSGFQASGGQPATSGQKSLPNDPKKDSPEDIKSTELPQASGGKPEDESEKVAQENKKNKKKRSRRGQDQGVTFEDIQRMAENSQTEMALQLPTIFGNQDQDQGQGQGDGTNPPQPRQGVNLDDFMRMQRQGNDGMPFQLPGMMGNQDQQQSEEITEEKINELLEKYGGGPPKIDNLPLDPRIGIQITTGPDWMWKQNGVELNETGRIVGIDKDEPGWVKVKWDNHNFTEDYRYGLDYEFDVQPLKGGMDAVQWPPGKERIIPEPEWLKELEDDSLDLDNLSGEEESPEEEEEKDKSGDKKSKSKDSVPSDKKGTKAKPLPAKGADSQGSDSAKGATATTPKETCFVWQYKDEQNNWRTYIPEIQKKLEETYLKRNGKGSAVIKMDGNTERVVFNIGNGNMEQRNVDRQIVRAVQRIEADAEMMRELQEMWSSS